MLWGPILPVRVITKTSAGLVMLTAAPPLALAGISVVAVVGLPVGGAIACGGAVVNKYNKWKYPPKSSEELRAGMDISNDAIYRKFHPSRSTTAGPTSEPTSLPTASTVPIPAV